MLKDLDTSIGMLLDFIEEQGIAENTYIFLMGDNGGRRSLNQVAIIDAHKQLRMAKYTSQPNRNIPLRDGKHSFYEGGIRVPFLVMGPGVKPGRVSDTPVTGLDLLPTFAELAGYEAPFPAPVDGGSLVPLLLDENRSGIDRTREALIFHQGAHRKPRSAIIKGPYKLIKYWGKESKYPHTPGIELYHIANDLSESSNLARQLPDLASDLENELVAFLDEVKAETRKRNIDDPFDRLVKKMTSEVNE